MSFPDSGFLHLDRVVAPASGDPVLAEIQGETLRVFEAPEIVGHLTLPVAEDDSITIGADQIPPVPDRALGLRIQYYYTPESVLQDNKRRAFLFLPREDARRSALKITPLGVASATAEVRFQEVLPVTRQYTTPILQLPAAARLEFACGLYQPWRVDTDSGARFVIEAGDGDTWTVLADLQISDADVFESTGWQHHGVDLSAIAERSVRLRFSTTPLPDVPEPQVSFPVWGNAVLTSAPAASARPGPNVVLISLDTLRADRLGAYGYGRNTSPNIDRFAAESILFEQAIVSAPWTTPSHASVFTGYHPRVHQA
ncbi:MAG: sulfatase-like hydrolase/transferase, partial [Candidatus Hydrogenedentes bacterium]|nr:sulfatase-like hydrolase/transferase [Candidatus Hydrogenedentota bacterium]